MQRAGFDPEKRQTRPFARFCGLKSETHLGLVMSGQRTGIDEKTARAVGRSTNVSWYWIQTGNGEPGPYEGDGAAPAPQVVTYQDAYSSRSAVIAMARAKGVDRAAIAALEAVRLKGEDPGEDYWMTKLVEFIAQSRRLDKALKEVTRDEHETFDEATPQPSKPSASARR